MDAIAVGGSVACTKRIAALQHQDLFNNFYEPNKTYAVTLVRMSGHSSVRVFISAIFLSDFGVRKINMKQSKRKIKFSFSPCRAQRKFKKQ